MSVAKPLTPHALKSFLDRFDFESASYNALDILSPSSLKLTLTLQDKKRGYDWIGLELTFNEVIDAKLVESAKLAFIDGSNFTLFYHDGLFFYNSDGYTTKDGTNNALVYIIAKTLKTREIEPIF